jgi:NADP-dependent 3-hydroxy acid dehydrogenase YdfG
MYERNFGTVISISSDADAQGFSTGAAYAASKFGLRGFIESLRCEARGTNVKICLISPARVDTNFNGKKPGDRPQSLTPSDVVDAIDYVLGTSARCVPSIIRLNSTLE